MKRYTLITFIFMATICQLGLISETVYSEMISIEKYKNKKNTVNILKDEQLSEKKRIKENYKKYVEKMKEPILIWGIGYQNSLAVQMRGKLNLNFGKDKGVKNFWSNVTVSKSLELGFDYNLAERTHLPKYYIFLPGAGLGIDLTSDYKTYVYGSVGGAYYFNRKFGIGFKYRKKLDDFKDFGVSNIGVFLEFRM